MKKTLHIFPAVILIAAFVSCPGCGGGSPGPLMQTGKAQVGDITIAYRIYTRGYEKYPLIMIMGLTGTQDLWDPDVIDAFSSRYKVIVFDNRGMGETANPWGAYTVEQCADDTAGLMDALGIQQAHVLGWSFGTNIAEELALRHPEKVDRLVLYAADCGGEEAIPPSEEVEQEIMSDNLADVLKALFPADWLANNYDYIVNLFASIVTESSTEEQKQLQYEAWKNWGGCCSQLGRIRSPTLLITGTEDVATPPANSAYMVELIPDALLAEIADGGHGVMYQFPDEFSEIILDFLD